MDQRFLILALQYQEISRCKGYSLILLPRTTTSQWEEPVCPAVFLPFDCPYTAISSCLTKEDELVLWTVDTIVCLAAHFCQTTAQWLSDAGEIRRMFPRRLWSLSYCYFHRYLWSHRTLAIMRLDSNRVGMPLSKRPRYLLQKWITEQISEV